MTSIAAYSYALAAVCFLVLGVPILLRWNARRSARPLALACLLSAAWSGAHAWAASELIIWSSTTGALEILRDAGWTAFLLGLRGHYRDPLSKLPFGLRGSLFAMGCLYALLLAGTLGRYWDLAPFSGLGLLPTVAAHVVFAVYGMQLIEQVYRNKSVPERWAIKFACIGIGGMFAYDFYMYSHTMLFREANPDIWAARGIVNALTVPLLAVSLGRSKSWTSPLAMSRRAMFHSAALFGSAAYLLAMGSAGYYLRFFGGSWGTVMQVTFLFGAIVLLAGILFSGTFRSWLKVFISKHFYRYDYDYREEWMRFTRALSAPGPNLAERAIEAVAALVESPGGVLWQRREGGCFEPVACWHAPAARAREDAESPFCQFLASRRWVIDLAECESHPDRYDGLAIPEWIGSFPRSRLVVPLVLQGSLFGFVVLQNPRSALKLNWEVIDLLGIAGSQAASYLAQQDAATALMVARQFESFNRMSTFVVHDLKNLVAQLSLMEANAERHRDNPEFQRDMQETVSYSVQKMKLLLQKLGRAARPEKPVPLAVEQVVRQAVALKAAFEPKPRLEIESGGLYVLADSERLERVLGHLVQNAIEATPRSGEVTIRVAASGGKVSVEIADTGAGMSEQFIRERLFTPFESTKSAGMGIGVFESREYIHELGGTLEVASTPGIGTSFKVILPLYQEQAQAIMEQAA